MTTFSLGEADGIVVEGGGPWKNTPCVQSLPLSYTGWVDCDQVALLLPSFQARIIKISMSWHYCEN